MTGMRSAILNQQQVCIDHGRRRRKLQQEDFVGQCEKVFTIAALKIRSKGILASNKFFVYQGR